MRCRPHFHEARLQDSRCSGIIYPEDAAGIVEVETADKVRVVRDREWLGDILQMLRRPIDKHAGAELAQQHHHARALR